MNKDFPVILVNSIERIRPLNNTVLVKLIANSISDYLRKYKLQVIRNESNLKNERSLGEIVALSNESYFSTSDGLKQIIELDKGSTILYNTRSIQAEFQVSNSQNTYYLIRVPDIIAKIEF